MTGTDQDLNIFGLFILLVCCSLFEKVLITFILDKALGATSLLLFSYLINRFIVFLKHFLYFDFLCWHIHE